MTKKFHSKDSSQYRNYDFYSELSKYEIPYDVISIEDIQSGKVDIPRSWSFVTEFPKSDWGDKLIEVWSTFEQCLPSFTKCIDRYLSSVEIIKIEGFTTLVYVFDIEGEVYLYYAGNPIDREKSNLDNLAIESFPSKLRDFYLNFHDGFGFLADASMGPISSFSFFDLSQPEWTHLNTNPEYPFGLNLNDWNVVYADEGTFLAINKIKVGDCILWNSDSPPRKVDFWETLDSYMTEGLLE